MKRLKVGVIGCGVIAQVMHLPHLSELEDRYDLAVVCDLSIDVANACRRRFGAGRSVERWEDLVDMDLDVVMVLTSGSHAPAAIAAADAGAHVFVEKPMCLSPAEGRAMIEAAQRAGVHLMVGTMKRYDPAYQRLRELLPAVEELRLVRVTTLESPFEPYVQQYPLVAPRDVPPTLQALREDDARRLEAALPGADEETRFCYRWMLLDNLVHELNALRGALGEPDEVTFANLSRTVVSINMTFGGVQCHLSWVDLLSGIARYRQEFMFLAPEERLTLTLPSPYLRNMPSELTVEGGQPGSAHAWARQEIVSYDEAFKRELVELHDAITGDRPPHTDGHDGLHDVTLCRSIAQAHLDRTPVRNPSQTDVETAGDGRIAS